jgi:hypothetical protein
MRGEGTILLALVAFPALTDRLSPGSLGGNFFCDIIETRLAKAEWFSGDHY